ncbi:MAG: hypothetical protein BGO41_03840 [Clostridiales bacterium 38-18]|nr:MAG: hypothetical protein BGO41_03840 [Clostridiales bacterium 38-18]
MKLEHFALWTKQLETMKDFYVTYFDARSNDKYTNHQKKFESYFLTFTEGARLELMTKDGLVDHPKMEALNTIDHPLMVGYVHLAISVGSKEQVDALTTRLRADGHTIYGEPRITGDGYYESSVLDPDGNIIEITI